MKEPKEKTQSQRLRDVLFRVFEATKPAKDFEAWYKFETERIIAHYKKKLS